MLREQVTKLAVSQLDVALQTVYRRVRATLRLHEVADVFAHEPRAGRREKRPVLPIDSQATGARQRPGGASDKLSGSRQVVRRASTTEEVTLMGRAPRRTAGSLHTKRLSGPWWRTRCTYRHPLPFFSCSHGQNGQLTVSQMPCSLSVGPELHTEWDNPLLKKLASHVSADSWASCC